MLGHQTLHTAAQARAQAHVQLKYGPSDLVKEYLAGRFSPHEQWLINMEMDVAMVIHNIQQLLHLRVSSCNES